MQPSKFEYRKAATLDEAVSLGSGGADYLAGGHSLIPAMKLRLSEPGTLVDISGIDDLKGINREGDTIKIGALTTHSEVASSDVVKDG